MFKMLPHTSDHKALHAIACFEGLKGFAAMAASIGLLSLAHQDVRALAYALIGQFHLDPQTHYPQMLLDEVAVLANSNLRQIVMFAWAYAGIRFLEGYGLWKDRALAEWLAATSGAVYLPWELNHLVQHATVINGIVLTGNIAVVFYMVIRLRRRKGKTKDAVL